MVNMNPDFKAQRIFVRRVTAVSLVAVLILGGILAALWLNRDPLYAALAVSQANRGSYDEAVKTAEKISDEALRQQSQYDLADNLYRQEAYGQAASLFAALGDYADCQERRTACDYALADQLYQSGAYEEALDAFAALGGYGDSLQRQQQTIYAMAEEASQNGDLSAAITLYLSIRDYSDSYEQAFQAAFALTGDKAVSEAMLASGGQSPESLEKILQISQKQALAQGAMVAAGARHTVVLYPDGTVAAWGDNSDGQCDVAGWKNIVQICAGAYHTVGLKADGTVVATGRNDQGACEVEGFAGITQIAAGDSDTYALSKDGQVFMTGYHSYDTITRAVGVSGIYAGSYGAVAATSAGTFISTHESYSLKPDSQILSIDLQTGYLLTQYLDGRLTASFDPDLLWADIVSYDAGPNGLVASDLQGKVRARFFREADAVEVSGLENVIQCAAGTGHYVFLTADGKLIALGDNSYGQCDVAAQIPME